MNKFLIAVCAAAGGLLAGLLIASLCGGSATRHADLIQERDGLIEERDGLRDRNWQLTGELSRETGKQAAAPKHSAGTSPGALERITAERDELIEERAESDGRVEPKAEQTKSADGPFNALCQYLRPGSAFGAFVGELQAQKVWDPGHYWVITGPDYLPDAHLRLFVPGRGKLNMEGIFHLKDFGTTHTTVSLIFQPGQIADPTLAGENRNRQMVTVARAMGMTGEEVARLGAALALLPSPRSNVELAIGEFVEAMPARAGKQFFDCCDLKPDQIDGDGPAIGIELSQRYVADIVFMATDLVSTYQNVPYMKIGTWWSIVLHHPTDVTYTSNNPDAWPRVTVDEIDRIR